MMKKLKVNKNEIIQKNNNKCNSSLIGASNYATHNAITLIALVITIIVILILASVTINLVIGERGILKRAEEIKKINKIAEIQEKLEVEKTSVFIDEKGKMTIGDYLEHIIKEGIITKEDIEATEQEYAKRITVEEEYVFLVEEEDNGNIKITYEGEVGKLKPNIELEIKEIMPKTITVKVTGKRMEKGEYSYYIKDIEKGEEYRLEETKAQEEYTFLELTPNKEYQIKVVAKNPYGETLKESEKIRTKEAYTVTYNINTDNIKTQLYEKGETALEPSFIPEIEGWEFVGWREDNLAQSEVITSKIVENTDITLYAVFKKTITLSYNGNKNNGGSTASQSGIRYYNNGNSTSVKFSLRANGFTKTNAKFNKWAKGSVGGTQYVAGASVTLTESTTFYARWYVKKQKTLTGSRSGSYQECNDVNDSFSIKVTFSPAFIEVPTVTTNVTWAGHQLSSKYYSCGTSGVTTTGMNFYMSIWETGAVNYGFTATWTAVGYVWVSD